MQLAWLHDMNTASTLKNITLRCCHCVQQHQGRCYRQHEAHSDGFNSREDVAQPRAGFTRAMPTKRTSTTSFSARSVMRMWEKRCTMAPRSRLSTTRMAAYAAFPNRRPSSASAAALRCSRLASAATGWEGNSHRPATRAASGAFLPSHRACQGRCLRGPSALPIKDAGGMRVPAKARASAGVCLPASSPSLGRCASSSRLLPSGVVRTSNTHTATVCSLLLAFSTWTSHVRMHLSMLTFLVTCSCRRCCWLHEGSGQCMEQHFSKRFVACLARVACDAEGCSRPCRIAP